MIDIIQRLSVPLIDSSSGGAAGLLLSVVAGSRYQSIAAGAAFQLSIHRGLSAAGAGAQQQMRAASC